MGSTITSPGSCQVAGAFNEDNIDISSTTKHLP
jgi:hypothetical protein